MDGTCARCKLQNGICRTPGGPAPTFCSTQLYQEALAKADKAYDDPATLEFAAQAARQESACYTPCPDNPGTNMPVKPRILEIIEFCKRMGYQKVGLAFCAGLPQEAAMTAEILESHGLTVVSAVCKVGGVDKSRIGVEAENKICRSDAHESMCNPIGQAEIMNAAGTQFNILLGLCVGHDSLFIKHSDAMCTVFAVKDRLLGHNPLAALYGSFYYKYLIQK